MRRGLISALMAVVLAGGMQCVALANPPGGQEENAPTEKVVTVASLNVRTSPDVKATVIGHLKKGEKVNEIVSNNSWSTIEFGGGVGFVYTPYIQVQTEPTAPVEKTMYTAAQTVNVRAGKGMGYPVIGHLEYGDKVSVLTADSDTNWYEIHFFSGVGFVAANNLMDETPGTFSTPAESIGVYTVSCPTTLNVRSGPGTSYGVIGSFRNGDRVNVFEITSGWAKVYSNDKPGYVYLGYLVQ